MTRYWVIAPYDADMSEVWKGLAIRPRQRSYLNRLAGIRRLFESNRE
jgi:hypothetical protein